MWITHWHENYIKEPAVHIWHRDGPKYMVIQIMICLIDVHFFTFEMWTSNNFKNVKIYTVYVWMPDCHAPVNITIANLAILLIYQPAELFLAFFFFFKEKNTPGKHFCPVLLNKSRSLYRSTLSSDSGREK